MIDRLISSYDVDLLEDEFLEITDSLSDIAIDSDSAGSLIVQSGDDSTSFTSLDHNAVLFSTGLDSAQEKAEIQSAYEDPTGFAIKRSMEERDILS